MSPLTWARNALSHEPEIGGAYHKVPAFYDTANPSCASSTQPHVSIVQTHYSHVVEQYGVESCFSLYYLPKESPFQSDKFQGTSNFAAFRLSTNALQIRSSSLCSIFCYSYGTLYASRPFCHRSRQPVSLRCRSVQSRCLPVRPIDDLLISHSPKILPYRLLLSYRDRVLFQTLAMLI